MLVELSKMEQRYDAVLGVIRDGYSVAEVAQAYGEPPERARLAGPLRERRLAGPGRPVPPSEILTPPDAGRRSALGGRTECKVLTGVDDHSRFCVCLARGEEVEVGLG